jgi:hypothetical protein
MDEPSTASFESLIGIGGSALAFSVLCVLIGPSRRALISGNRSIVAMLGRELGSSSAVSGRVRGSRNSAGLSDGSTKNAAAATLSAAQNRPAPNPLINVMIMTAGKNVIY